MARKKDKAPAQQSTMAGVDSDGWARAFTKRNLVLPLVVIVLLVGGITAWYFRNTSSSDMVTEKAELQTLQTSLSAAVNDANDPEVLSTTSQLINGAKSSQFTISTKSLAQYHLDRAAVFTDYKQYSKVITESGTAAKLDQTIKLAALQYELGARNALGQRQQLIPILQQLVQLEKTSGDPMRGSAIAGYQEDIQALQHNEEIHLQ